MTRIVIVEDHRVVADALATMLELADGFDVAATLDSGSDAVDRIDELAPDIVLMDVSLRGLNGIEATRRIIERRPETRVVVLSMHDDPDTVANAMAAGAAGYLPKHVARDELLAGLRVVADGGAYLHPAVTRPFLDRVVPLADRALARERLTEREHEVLQLLADGMSGRQIAEALFVSEETVKTHLGHIYQKLGVADRVQAVATAIRTGLVR